MLLYKYVVYILHGDTDVKNRGKGNRYYDCSLRAFVLKLEASLGNYISQKTKQKKKLYVRFLNIDI